MYIVYTLNELYNFCVFVFFANQMSLMECKNTVIGVAGQIRGLSGGEMKRLSFASEVSPNNKLIFM